jgi:hypothetical protein
VANMIPSRGYFSRKQKRKRLHWTVLEGELHFFIDLCGSNICMHVSSYHLSFNFEILESFSSMSWKLEKSSH